MPDINILGNISADLKKLTSKLSFQIGEVFSAKIMEANEKGTEIVLKMADGWQFPAKLLEPQQDLPKGMVRFKVNGYKEGKLEINMLTVKEEDSDADAPPIKDNLNVKSDGELLKNLLKHNMPLTKENVTFAKSIMDFKQKMEENSTREDTFISKYMESKGISLNREKGAKVFSLLKNFFNELKKTSLDDILTLKENNIDINTENLKSFNKVFKENMTIFNDVMTLGENETSDKAITTNDINSIKEDTEETVSNNNSNFTDEIQGEKVPVEVTNSWTDFNNEKVNEQNIWKESIGNFISDIKDTLNSDQSTFNNVQHDEVSVDQAPMKSVTDNVKHSTVLENRKNDIENDFKDLIPGSSDDEDSLIAKYLQQAGVGKNSDEGKEAYKSLKEYFTDLKEFTSDNTVSLKNFKELIKDKNPVIKEFTKFLIEQKLSNNTNDLVKSIKNQISEKTELMKNLIQLSIDGKLSDAEKNLNDFKVFNTVSNQYYFMDIPLKIQQKEYELKLLIKDDRKKGKHIDTKNVKLVASVKTVHLGMVDAFIKVKDKNIEVNLKCKNDFIKILESSKQQLTDILAKMNYIPYISVQARQEDADIVSTREFFQDTDLGSINVRV